MATRTRMPGRFKAPSFQVDDRTSKMSDVALRCRMRGHKWEEASISRRRFAELAKLGQEEENLFCERQCGNTWYRLWDIESETVLEQKRTIPEGDEYKMPVGSGRLRRSAARKAFHARQLGMV